MREHVVADDKVRPLAIGHQRLSCHNAEELDNGWNPSLHRDRCDVCRWLNAQCGNSACYKIPEQIAVIACQLDYLALRREIKARGDHLDIPLGMLQP